MTGDRKDVPSPGGHPEADLIAAHAERRLGGAEAARMDAHLAACSSCYEVFAETLRFVLDEEAEDVSSKPASVTMAFVRRPVFQLVAALAAAAAVVVAFYGIRRARSPQVQPALVADLARAMGAGRFVEPRLTGGFQHGRLVVLRSGEAPRGLDAYPPAVLAAVARIRERAESAPSAEASGALGITYLVSGDLGAAQKALESATAQDPASARLLSDLAAVYLVKASRLDEPADLPKALEAAEKAITLKDPPAEAYFNRALALEALHLTDAARDAWNDYLKRDSTSGWAGEARRHLEELPRERPSSVEEDRARVRAAIQEGPGAVEALAAETPTLPRNYFQDELLPAWADAYLEGRPNEAQLREEARLLGDAILHATGDALPRDTARALHPAPAVRRSGDGLRAQAQGFRALREAQRLWDQVEPSCDPNRTAVRELEAGGSPRAHWARLQAAITCLFPAEPEAAAAELSRLEAGVPPPHAQLRARLLVMQGLLLVESGDLTASLARYRSARDAFVGIRDGEGEARTRTLIAQNLGLLGESRRAWHDRVSALALLERLRRPRNRHAILDEAVQACLAERTPRSGLRFEDALVAFALQWGAAAPASEALLRRAALHHALGASPAAARDLEESRRFMARLSEPRLRERLVAQAEATSGEILTRTQPEAAARSLRQSLAHFRATAPQRVPSLELLLARALLREGLKAAAEHELQNGIDELERQRTSLRDVSLQISFLDQGMPLFDDMARLLVGRGEHERALSFVERGRSRQILDALLEGQAPRVRQVATTQVAGDPLEPREIRGELPEGVALLHYMALEDRLFAWALTRDGARFAERALSAARLGQLVARHRAALEPRASVGAARHTGAVLYDELVRPLLPAVTSASALIVIPGVALQAVPFASLFDRTTGRYLVEDHLLGVAPSGTVFVRASSHIRADRREGHVLILGNPRIDPEARPAFGDLPGAEAEAAEIAALYDSADLLTGSRATRRAFLERVSAGGIVHYAGHGAPDAEMSSSPQLLLAPDGSPGDSGRLDLRDLSPRTFAHTRLVVLSACRTAAGATSSSEGALSLGRPFLAAGVPNVLASLWDIDDAVSRRFSVAFHRALRAEGEPLRALRQAQIALLRDDDPSHAHPGTWAAFVCLGGLDRAKAVALVTEAPRVARPIVSNPPPLRSPIR